MAAVAAPLAAQEPNIKITPIARMQFQYNTTSVDEEALIAGGKTLTGFAESSFELRRIRFGAEVTYNDWITGMFESELAMARLQMRNMYINLQFMPEFGVRFGQFKRPFSIIELTSDFALPIIERGVRIRGLSESLSLEDSLAGGTRVLTAFRGTSVAGEEFDILTQFGHISYDIGAVVRGRIGQFGYDVGMFNGEGTDRFDTNDDKSFAGRLTYTLKTGYPVILGGAFSYRETRTAVKPELEDATATAFSGDLELGAFRRNGLHFIGEVAFGDNLVFDDESFFGIQGMFGYFIPVKDSRVEGLEIAGRASYGDPRKDIDDDEAMLFTPGFNVYFMGRNRLMLNWDIYNTKGERLEGENALRFQAQVYF